MNCCSGINLYPTYARPLVIETNYEGGNGVIDDNNDPLVLTIPNNSRNLHIVNTSQVYALSVNFSTSDGKTHTGVIPPTGTWSISRCLSQPCIMPIVQLATVGARTPGDVVTVYYNAST